jgi:hypothetical protein
MYFHYPFLKHPQSRSLYSHYFFLKCLPSVDPCFLITVFQTPLPTQCACTCTHTHTHTHTHTNTPANFSQPQGLTSLWMTTELRSQQCRCAQIGCGPHYHLHCCHYFYHHLYPVGSVVYCLLFLKVAMHLIGTVVSE